MNANVEVKIVAVRWGERRGGGGPCCLDIIRQVELNLAIHRVVEGRLTQVRAVGTPEGIPFGAVTAASYRGLERVVREQFALGLQLPFELSAAADAVLAGAATRGAVLGLGSRLGEAVFCGQKGILVGDGLTRLQAEGLRGCRHGVRVGGREKEEVSRANVLVPYESGGESKENWKKKKEKTVRGRPRARRVVA